ncbi:SpoIIE family protein phosphatase [Streptomyces sp. NPDC058867]|uniref:SpoIIE family protein phosphatase n=1 Tax=unclassified Streptomyces TaxID=2593676 RepID=UPI0036AFF958
MGAIPTQRETVFRASDVPVDALDGPVGPLAHESGRPRALSRATLPGSPVAPGSARALLRAGLAAWAELDLPGTERHTDRLVDDAVLVVSELVTNAVVHAGTDVELVCRMEEGTGAIVVEVGDRHPGRAPRDGAAEPDRGTPEYGRGLGLVARLADWCAVWLEDEVGGRGWTLPGTEGAGPPPARVWHACEHLIEDLRRALEADPPRPSDDLRSGPVPYPWPKEALGERDPDGTALAYRLVAGGRPLGTLVIGRAGPEGFPDEVTGLVEDLGRRVALAIGAARQYARQATISAVLQRGLLPGAVAEIPGLASALVYEPCVQGGPSGDFYDLFPAGDGRWCFAVGDVQGKGPEAAVVIGLARPWLRLLAREGYGVADVLDRLNQLLLDDATEAADARARALVGPAAPGDGPQTRFLSLLYGELAPFEGGVRCTLASAGHPLPLLLDARGGVRTAAQPQTLLGVVEDATYTSETLELRAGDSLLCVTDGVTERRSGTRQFDDGDGLAAALAGCAGLGAQSIAERIRRLVHDFGGRPPEDDLALLVLQAE